MPYSRALRGAVPSYSTQDIEFQIESYLRTHSSLEFTHSLCPTCEQRMFGDEQWFKAMKR